MGFIMTLRPGTTNKLLNFLGVERLSFLKKTYLFEIEKYYFLSTKVPVLGSFINSLT